MNLKYKWQKHLKITSILVALSLILFLFGLNEALVLKIYSNGIYPILSGTLRTIIGIVPFAVGDILYLLLIGLSLYYTLLFVKGRKSLTKAHRFTIPLKIFNIALVLYLSFKILWGLNYSRPSISEQLQISHKKYKVEELIKLGNFFVNRLNKLQHQVNTTLPFDFEAVRTEAVASYQHMALTNSFYSYQHPSVKPVLNSWLVSKTGIEGYYNPLSGEANVNTRLLPWVLPFVTCHEMAHQLGVAREDEANLVAYLVGANSQDLRFKYAVVYTMLRYILFEISIKSPQDYLIMRKSIDPRVLQNFKAENEFWKKYNGDMSDYMGAAFDKFLKLNSQKKGIKSYQNIVIWLYNIHRNELI